jgi:hypothetical protein
MTLLAAEPISPVGTRIIGVVIAVAGAFWIRQPISKLIVLAIIEVIRGRPPIPRQQVETGDSSGWIS